MKPFIFVAALLFCAPLARAQDAPATKTAPAPTTPDPDSAQTKAAADLLTRTATRYNKLQTFETLIEREVTGGLTAFAEHRVYRLQLDASGNTFWATAT